MTAIWIDHITRKPMTDAEIDWAVEGGIHAGDIGMSPEPGQLWERLAECGEILPGDRRTFLYAFVHDGKTTMPELARRDGQEVLVLGEASDYDREDVGPMYQIRFADGFVTDAFEDELR